MCLAILGPSLDPGTVWCMLSYHKYLHLARHLIADSTQWGRSCSLLATSTTPPRLRWVQLCIRCLGFTTLASSRPSSDDSHSKRCNLYRGIGKRKFEKYLDDEMNTNWSMRGHLCSSYRCLSLLAWMWYYIATTLIRTSIVPYVVPMQFGSVRLSPTSRQLLKCHNPWFSGKSNRLSSQIRRLYRIESMADIL